MELVFQLTPDLLAQLIELDHLVMDYSWSTKQWHELARDLSTNKEESRYRLFVETSFNSFALFESSAGEWSHLIKIATHPNFQKRSSAYRLMKKACEYYVGQKCRSMTLELREDNLAALGLYKKLGFQIDRKVKSFYSDGESAYKMIIELFSEDSAAPC